MAIHGRKKEERAEAAEVAGALDPGSLKRKTRSLPGVDLLPLKNDLIFKLVFGDQRYAEITRAFLIATLDIPAEEYEDLQIIDPHLERDAPENKLGILDVRIQLTNKKLISVEIQVRGTPSMAERVAFSTGRNLSRQIAPGQGYMEIARVVTIVITNFEMIASDNFYHHIFKLYDAEKKTLFTDVMEIHTLELQKLPETTTSEDDKERELLDWLRLIRSERKEEIEMLASKTPEMGKAVGRLKRLSADEATRLRYEARELYLMDEMARRAKAYADGLAEGEAKGRVEMAKNLLANGVSPEIIAKSSGLSLDKVKGLSRDDNE